MFKHVTPLFYCLERLVSRTEERKGIQLPMGLLFWMIMILWLLFGFYWGREDFRGGNYGAFGGNLLLFVLLGLLGWRAFGAPLQ